MTVSEEGVQRATLGGSLARCPRWGASPTRHSDASFTVTPDDSTAPREFKVDAG